MATYGTYNTPGGFKLTVYGIVIAACFLLGLYVIRGMYREHNPGPIGAQRGVERKNARVKLEAEARQILERGASSNAPYRLSITQAMQMTVDGYKSPEAAHSNLVARMQRATAPAPAAPEQPSEFE